MKKAILSVGSNVVYRQSENTEFQLIPLLELVIIHTDGKVHSLNRDGTMVSQLKCDETRLMVNSESLDLLIKELTIQREKMAAVANNAKQINELVNILDND